MVILENLAAIAVSDVAQSGVGVGLTTGVFTVKAKAADDIKQGAIVYWSATEGATITAGSNKRLGRCVARKRCICGYRRCQDQRLVHLM